MFQRSTWLRQLAKHTFHFPPTPLFILPDIQSANVSEMCLKTTVRQDLVLSFKVTNNLINRQNIVLIQLQTRSGC